MFTGHVTAEITDGVTGVTVDPDAGDKSATCAARGAVEGSSLASDPAPNERC